MKKRRAQCLGQRVRFSMKKPTMLLLMVILGDGNRPLCIVALGLVSGIPSAPDATRQLSLRMMNPRCAIRVGFVVCKHNGAYSFALRI